MIAVWSLLTDVMIVPRSDDSSTVIRCHGWNFLWNLGAEGGRMGVVNYGR